MEPEEERPSEQGKVGGALRKLYPNKKYTKIGGACELRSLGRHVLV
jgi:hypothetical protein